jgi:hypothetical protein
MFIGLRGAKKTVRATFGLPEGTLSINTGAFIIRKASA